MKMNLLDFTTIFPNEESCKQKFKAIREKQGIVCPSCGGKSHYWKQDKEMYECKHCKRRQSIRSQTVMHQSKLPFRYWFVAMHLLSCTKKSFSALELQRQLGHKRYEPIWLLLHKLRAALGNRDAQYQLVGVIELDEGFFTAETTDNQKDEKLKRGRGSQRKQKVLVMAESEIVEEDKKNKRGKSRKVNHIKMLVINDLKSETIDSKVIENVDNQSYIDTDNSTSYVNLKNIVAFHNPKVLKKEEVGKALPWVHIAISNAKRLLLDIYHDVKPEYLQNYLNEFCYKFNRRYFGNNLFDRMLIASISHKNQFRY